jgi:hypothetical protein
MASHSNIVEVPKAPAERLPFALLLARMVSKPVGSWGRDFYSEPIVVYDDFAVLPDSLIIDNVVTSLLAGHQATPTGGGDLQRGDAPLPAGANPDAEGNDAYRAWRPCHQAWRDHQHIPIYGVHRDERLWNEPLRFDPARFSAEAKSRASSLRLYALKSVLDVERLGAGRLVVRIERDLLDLGFRLAQQRIAMRLQRLSPLIDLDRGLKLHVALFQAIDDGFELLQRLLEAHILDVGVL